MSTSDGDNAKNDTTMSGVKDATDGPVTLYVDDTVALRDKPEIVGMITRTWHSSDEPYDPEEIRFVRRGQNVSKAVFREFEQTAQMPRGYVVAVFVDTATPPLFLPESDLILLNRDFLFGDYVKRSATDYEAGTVIGISTSLDVRHCFTSDVGEETLESVDDDCSPVSRRDLVKGIPEDDVRMDMEWEEGDCLIYDNGWVGIVDQVITDPLIRLSNDSVVIPEDPGAIEVPMLKVDNFSEDNSDRVWKGHGVDAQQKSVENAAWRWRNVLLNFSGNTQSRSAAMSPPALPWVSVPAPSNVGVGQYVMTSKANLRQGTWIYGSYNPEVAPVGIVVETQLVEMAVHWICPNLYDFGRQTEMPPMTLGGEELNLCKKFKKSNNGISRPLGGGMPQVGDRIRFKDLEAAQAKFNTEERLKSGKGYLKKIPRTVCMGYDVNVFQVERTESHVEVQWQDGSVTTEKTTQLVPLWNMDEHESFPGEIVFSKIQEDAPPQPPPAAEQHQQRRPQQPIMSTLPALAQPLPTGSSEGDEKLLRPKTVGIIQSVNGKSRTAKVRWFENPQLEILGSILLPGGSLGKLKEGPGAVEEMSLYEIVRHQSLGFCRGDLVLIARNQTAVGPDTPSTPQPQVPVIDNSPPNAREIEQVEALRHFIRRLRDADANHPMFSPDAPGATREQRLLAELVSSVGNAEPTDQQILGTIRQIFTTNRAPRTPNEPPSPVDWFGEVVDVNIDGTLTVRLGFLEDTTDITVTAERLTVVYNEDLDAGDDGFDDGMDMMDGLDSDDYDSEDETDSEIEPIEVSAIYEGGQRIDDDDGDEAWSTEDEMDLDIDEDDEPVETSDKQPVEIVSQDPTTQQTQQNQSKQLATGVDFGASDALPRFEVLEGDAPNDHAYKATPPVAFEGDMLRRINKEHKILRTSLPDGIFVRTWENRLDLLRVLIIGPMNTPYELAPFVFDFHLTSGYPHKAPNAFFHSWTKGIGRCNPNLYENGKICLSLLGTWHSEQKGESWSTSSTILQLLVSLMGLVLVKDPFYNEAGYDSYVGARDVAVSAGLYIERAYMLSRGFVRHVLENPVAGFEKEIQSIYIPGVENGLGLLKQVVSGVEKVIKESTEAANEGRNALEISPEGGVVRVTAGALMLLKKDLVVLEKFLEPSSGSSSSA
ncbi:hypothetical protein BJ508DRAFT_414973 [Ascobolus immersus RN42]|uniref:UBC core domain-containing protein n=1 Tax=Ascobolus immersus RN42 TaxID=1160509 RepID=A0A3N4I4Z4_ASCIM|nr:hypothetical protein BJ508DRAFT_414973 [Ascobolus immersus RN42]